MAHLSGNTRPADRTGFTATRGPETLQVRRSLEEIKAALGEAHAELRVWRKEGAIYPASRTSISIPRAT